MKKLTKLQYKNIFYMICYCIDELKYFNDGLIDYENITGTHDLLAELLCKSFEYLHNSGYIKKYSVQQIVTDKPRGRIDIPKSINTGNIEQGKINCTVDNLNIDNKLNRIVKSAFSILIGINSNIEDKINKNLITKLDNYRHLLKYVSDIDINRQIIDGLGDVPEQYKPVIVVSKLIIEDYITLDENGEHRLLELNDSTRLCYIWEKFLDKLLELHFKNCTHYYQEKLSDDSICDTLIEDKSTGRTLILDAKWYNSGLETSTNRNVMKAYCTDYITYYRLNNRGLMPNGLILYASDKESKINKCRGPLHLGYDNDTIDSFVVTAYINVNNDFDSIKHDIIEIADKVIRLLNEDELYNFYKYNK